MSKHTNKDHTIVNQFFKDDSEYIQSILKKDGSTDYNHQESYRKSEGPPRLDAGENVDKDTYRIFWQDLRSFFRNGNDNKDSVTNLWSVLLAPHMTNDLVSEDFPLWLGDHIDSSNDDLCSPLKLILERCINQIKDQGQDSGIIVSHIDLLNHIFREELNQKPNRDFKDLISHVLNQFSDQLKVTGEDIEPFQNELSLMQSLLPDHGRLINYSDKTVFHLLDLALGVQSEKWQKLQDKRIQAITNQLSNLIEVEKGKSGNSEFSDQSKTTLPFAESLMKFDALANLQPEEGSELMDPVRYKRITNILKPLNSSMELFNKSAYLFFEERLKDQVYNSRGLFDGSEIISFSKSNGVDILKSKFKEEIDRFVELFKALRIADLELKNNYISEVHDDYFDHFNWKEFSIEELNACPYFVLIADNEDLTDSEHSNLSKLIAANYPINIISLRNEDSRNSSDSIWGKEEYLHKHEEVAAMMLSYKNIYVLQTSGIKPVQMYNAISKGLTSFAPSFIHILNPGNEFTDKPYLWASSSIESRDFPLFSFEGLLGTSWGSRFNIDHNPQADSTWPFHSIRYVDEGGEYRTLDLQFTFADQYVMRPSAHKHYKIVPAAYWSDNLVSIPRYLKMENDERVAKVPFIWMIDHNQVIKKVAIDWTLVIACQERLDFWRFLQENSGINNYHVKEAVQKIKMEMKEVFDFETAQLKKVHASEIQKIREEESDKVIDNLANVLLDMDISDLSLQENAPLLNQKPSGIKKSAEELIEDQNPDNKSEPEEEKEEVIIQDPYIESSLCTACDECTGINNKMFLYNEDKLAYIADSYAGTYKQLVEAAEACPVGIIHPGSPVNKEEPGLEELIGRAKKFN